ncbi:Holliday junction branch migration protein RuvA [Verrucomicrobiota bacterium]
MITFLEGKIEDKHPTSVVLNVAGVGYEVFVPLSSYDRLPAKSESCRVLTYDHVREDTHQLFGFVTEEERRMFLLLIGISGIGPKLALSALSGLTARELTAAIVEGDIKRISSISGIGKKMAERIVVDLKDKIGKGEALEAIAGAGHMPEGAAKMRDAVLALISLGYKQNAARKMVATVLRGGESDNLSVEDIIKQALAGK